MAKRDPGFRDSVLSLDGFRCVLCGFNGEDENDRWLLEADHVIGRGAGGNPAMDDPDNGMTLCRVCHAKKTAEIISIRKWDRNDEENGLLVFRKDNPSGAYKKEEEDNLWFYRKNNKKLLEDSIGALSMMAESEARRARILYFVWKNFDLADAKSPEQLVAGIGLDPNRSRDEARLYEKLAELGLEWPDGVNYAKASLILKAAKRDGVAAGHSRDEYKEILISASDSSYSDLEKTLMMDHDKKAKQDKSERKNLYLVSSRENFFENCKFVFGDEGNIALSGEFIVLRVDKVLPPLRRWKNTMYITRGEVEEVVDVPVC
jgi:hypothetical protein